jgi:hypothetical protein
VIGRKPRERKPECGDDESGRHRAPENLPGSPRPALARHRLPQAAALRGGSDSSGPLW